MQFISNTFGPHRAASASASATASVGIVAVIRIGVKRSVTGNAAEGKKESFETACYGGHCSLDGEGEECGNDNGWRQDFDTVSEFSCVMWKLLGRMRLEVVRVVRGQACSRRVTEISRVETRSSL
jgi:hypothetical protein